MDKAIAYGLNSWFEESHSWDEAPTSWKDIRLLQLDLLVDDSPHHQEAARQFGLENHYVVVSAYGSPEAVADPQVWVRTVQSAFANL